MNAELIQPGQLELQDSLYFKESGTLDLDSLRQRCKDDFYFFAKGVLGYDWLTPHIHMPICRLLEDKSIHRRLIVFPRGWLKTTICTVSWPIWLSIKDPNIRILITQNSATNAFKKLGMIRRQWEENVLLKALFPELLPTSSCDWRSDSACLNRSQHHPESTYEAAGTRTAVVSRHYNVVVEDDTVAPDLDELGMESLAPSQADVEQAIGWHTSNVLPLLNNPQEDEILVVGTRWYERDLINYVLENEKHYTVVSRAAREDEDGNPDPKGRIVYPERFNQDTLFELETTLGPYLFSCLYMNTPVRSEDMLFKPDWIKYYETAPPPQSSAIYTTVDPATDPSLAKGKDLDYTVVMTCAKDMVRGQIYVLEYTRIRGSPGELAAEVFRHVQTYRPLVVGYEDIGFQRSLDYFLKELMRQENLYFLLEPVPGGAKGKIQRIPGLQPIMACGDLLIRSHMKDLEAELLAYPLGRHDDVIDALSMQLHFWRMTNTAKKEPPPEAPNPLSFEQALAEIDARRFDETRGGEIFEPMRTESDLKLMLGFG